MQEADADPLARSEVSPSCLQCHYCRQTNRKSIKLTIGLVPPSPTFRPGRWLRPRPLTAPWMCIPAALFPRHSSVSYFSPRLQISKCYYFTSAPGSRRVFISTAFFSHVHGEMRQNGRSWSGRRICTFSIFVLCTALLILDPIMIIT